MKKANIISKEEKKAPIFYTIIGTLFGIGYFPAAPATAASIVVCLIVWFLFKSTFLHFVSIIILFPCSVWVSSRLENFWEEDSRKIVIDEAVGMLITLFCIPQNIIFFIIGFFLFRFFDIVKPYPINVSQMSERGWGVVMDDVIAGMYSSILLWIIIFSTNRFIGI